MIEVKGICLSSRDKLDYFSIFIMIDHGKFRSANTIYFPAVDNIKSFLYNVSEELKCTVEDITFAPHVNLGIVGIVK